MILNIEIPDDIATDIGSSYIFDGKEPLEDFLTRKTTEWLVQKAIDQRIKIKQEQLQQETQTEVETTMAGG